MEYTVTVFKNVCLKNNPQNTDIVFQNALKWKKIPKQEVKYDLTQ